MKTNEKQDYGSDQEEMVITSDNETKDVHLISLLNACYFNNLFISRLMMMKLLDLHLRNENDWEEIYLTVIVILLLLNRQFIVLPQKNLVMVAIVMRVHLMDLSGKIN